MIERRTHGQRIRIFQPVARNDQRFFRNYHRRDILPRLVCEEFMKVIKESEEKEAARMAEEKARKEKEEEDLLNKI